MRYIFASSLLLFVSSVSASACLVFDSDFNLFALGVYGTTDWNYGRQDAWVCKCNISHVGLVIILMLTVNS